MKNVFKFCEVLILTCIVTVGSGQPRLIKGTVWSKEGKRCAGVIVTAHKSKDKYFTSFDGYYEINANIKSKWIKFTFPDRVEKINIEGITRDVIDFNENHEKEKPDSGKGKKSVKLSKIKN